MSNRVARVKEGSGYRPDAVHRGVDHGSAPGTKQIRAPQPEKATPIRTPGLANKGAGRDLFRHQGSPKAARTEND